jgi:hypothetical protein
MDECYSRNGMTMSMTSLLVSLDETESVAGIGAAVAGVDDLENSWVNTGMAIAVKGMTITSRWRLARKSVSQNRRVDGMLLFEGVGRCGLQKGL